MIKERELCKVFYEEVQLRKQLNNFNKNFFIFHVANEQKTNIAYTLMLKSMGLTSGVADYCILYEGGKVAFIEFKRNKKCKLTKSQEAFKNICEALNVPYFMTCDVQDAIKFLNRLFN